MTAREELLRYIEQHPEELQKIVTPTDTGADIDGAELRKIYNLLGFDGEKEVRDIDYDLADTLSRMYKKLSDNSQLRH